MNPFGNPSKRISDSYPVQFIKRPAVLITALCLIAGVTVVAWRTRVRTTETQARARAEALAVSSNLELQFDQAISAVEVLQALARQSEPVMPAFQRVASDLLASRPSVAALELLPGGVVSAAVPLAGNERAIGYNVLKDPAHRFAVNSAMQKRSVAVAGPLRLWDGAPGIRVLAPLFHKGRDGKEVFWGFVACAMRLAEVFNRAELLELGRKGYDFAVIATAPATQAPVRLAEFGEVAPTGALQQPIHARNLELTLAMRPHRGWLNAVGMWVRFVGVIVLSSFVCAFLVLWRKRSEAQAALAAANRQFAQEMSRRSELEKQLQSATDGASSLEAELARVRGGLEQAGAHTAELRGRLEQVEQQSRQAQEEATVRCQQLENHATELVSQLEILREAAKKASQASELELQRLQGELEEGRLAAAQLENRCEKLMQEKKQLAAAAQAEQQQLQATVADLQARFDAAARTSAEATSRNGAQIAGLRNEIRELKAAVQDAESRADALAKELEEAKGELARQADAIRLAAVTPAESAEQVAPAVPSPEPEFAEEQAEETSAVQFEDNPPAVEAHAEQADQDVVAVASSDAPVNALPDVAAATVELSVPESAPIDVPSASPLVRKTTPRERGRKAQRQDQMDLFSAPSSAAEVREDALPEAGLFTDESEVVVAKGGAGAEEETIFRAEEAESSPVDTASELEGDEPARPDPKPHRTGPMHHARTLSAEETAELRKAVHQIVPLLADQDPGAVDCLKDNRATFRSAFTPEGFTHFQEVVKAGEYLAGLDHLRKAVKRHGISA